MRTLVVSSCLLLVASARSASAQDETRVLLLLWPDGAPDAKGKLPQGVKDGKLTLDPAVKLSKHFNDGKLADVSGVVVFPAPKDKANGAAVVICPGGGYGFLAADHEGSDIAHWFNSLGVTAVVLKYRLGPRYHYPTQLHDAHRALRLTRHNAKDWGIDPNRVGILGFSAGGHLTSTALTQFDDSQVDAIDPIERQSCRPDFGVLVYPVIRLEGLFSHGGSRVNLLGKEADAKLIDSLNNDKRVTDETPPTFLVHTSEDRGVPPENSALFYMALTRHKVPAELHIYEKGAHGLGLGPAGLAYSTWPERCAAWMRGRGILKDAK
jgi:acetyl esterase/lipase